MAEFRDYFYQQLTCSLNDKPPLSVIQESRKERYTERANRPEPKILKEKKRRIRVIVESSDDEMPISAPKIRKIQCKKTKSPKKIVEIVLDDNGDVVTCPSIPTTPNNSENTDPVEKAGGYTPDSFPTTPRISFTPNSQLRGRLPPWYHERKALEKMRKEENRMKKEARLNREKGMKENEEQAEKRRKRDRERKRDLTLKKKLEEAEKNGQDTEKILEEHSKLDEKMKKRSVKNKRTDPSFDPSVISLGAPEIVPWAKRKSKVVAPPVVVVEAPESPIGNQEIECSDDEIVEIIEIEELMTSPGIPTLEDDELIILEEAEDGELLEIPDEEIQTFGIERIDDDFLSFMNDDDLLDDPVYALNELL